MAPESRQERLQMRRRGAGTRKVNNVDFGFTFGATPARTRKSTSKTPQPMLRSVGRSSEFTLRKTRHSSVSHSERNAAAADQELVSRNPSDHQADGSADVVLKEPARKRRKTADATLTYAEPDAPAPLLGQVDVLSTKKAADNLFRSQSRKRRRTSGPAFVQIAEDPQEVDQSLAKDPFTISNAVDVSTMPISPKNQVIYAVEKENAYPEEVQVEKSSQPGTSKSNRRKRRSIGQQSTRRKTKLAPTESGPSFEGEGRSDPVPHEALGAFENDQSTGGAEADSSLSLSLETGSNGSAQVQTTEKKRRRRKSVVLKPRKRKISHRQSLPNATSTIKVIEAIDTEEDRVSNRVQTPRTHLTPGADLEEREMSLPDTSDRRDPGRFSVHETIQTPKTPAYSDSEGDEDETYVEEEHTPEPVTPAVAKKALQKRASKRKRSSLLRPNPASPQPGRKPVKSTFPILTHRLTNLTALPTITEESGREDVAGDDDDEENTDPLSTALKSSFPSRPNPNAVDILSQICRETIATFISKLSNPTTVATGVLSKKDLKRKQANLEKFSSALDSQLFDLSAMIEYRLTLEGRTRAARREKGQAQREWIEVRRQREEVALQCDEVRRRHWEGEAESSEQRLLSERLFGAEMEVERCVGRAPEEEEDGGEDPGLEYLVKSVAARATGERGGGLLERVRELNRRLERTAALLETSGQ